MKSFLTRWLATTIAVAFAVKMTDMNADGWFPLGIINAVIRPVLLLLSLPFILVTLGLFILVVNALMLWVVAKIVPGFHIDDFTTAFFGALIISIVNWALSAVFKGNDGQYHVMTHHTEVRSGMKRVEGRVIDSDSRG